ncbi:hypothetical protein KR018_001517, partial [Drosophila ironensis]
DIIRSHNYPVESHTVITRDGYILQGFRIPRSNFCYKNGIKPAVLFLHGMTASADVFLLNGPQNALPFMLADSCYDVWLANFRGTRYSRRHISINPKKKAFWRFSFHEIGVEDVAAFIDYIGKKTQQQAVHVVSHSQGGTTLLVLLSMRPEYNNRVKTAILLAPAAFMKNTWTLGQYMLTPLIKAMPDVEFMYHNPALSTLTSTICRLGHIGKTLCSFYLLINGGMSAHMNTSVLPLVLATHPAGISSRQPKHFIQLTESGKFRQYDYGFIQNMWRYKRELPPDYALQNVHPLSPVDIFFSDDDSSTNATDILRLGKALPSVVMHRMSKPTWHHMDFLHSMTVAEDINKPIIRIFDQYE